jgi:hypothetical protein
MRSMVPSPTRTREKLVVGLAALDPPYNYIDIHPLLGMPRGPLRTGLAPREKIS